MSTFAFAGVYLSTLIVPAALCAVLLIAYRPWPARTATGKWTPEVWLTLAVGISLIQLLRLPGSAVDRISPHARAVWQQLALGVPPTIPLSIDPAAGAWASLVAGCTLVTFLAARHVFARGAVRRIARAIATIGLVVSAIALAQEASAHGLMYWRWRPIQEGADPFGPFVNRNHFGTWAILAVPVVLGYLAAHATAHHRSGSHHSWKAAVRRLADARAVYLVASVVFMLAAVAVSLSRSAMFGLVVAALLAVWLRPAGGPAGRRHPGGWIAAALVLAAVAIMARIDPVTLSTRLAAAPVSAASRLAIWRDTLPVIRDFWLTGTGAGTYETVMLVYQRSTPEVRFNQAHNHYLQLAAEGGLLLMIPLALALRAYVRDVRDAMTSDRSPMNFVRAGALCGLAGVAAQSIWETGLTTPANALLAAVLAAIVVHVPTRPDPAEDA